MKDKQADQLIAVLILVIAAIITSATRSGGEIGKQSYIESQKRVAALQMNNQFCLEFAKSISGTTTHKNSIYQNCKGE